MNPNDSLGGMAEQTRNQFIYSYSDSERSWASPKTEIDIERVNIRPRKVYFIELINFGRFNMIK